MRGDLRTPSRALHPLSGGLNRGTSQQQSLRGPMSRNDRLSPRPSDSAEAGALSRLRQRSSQRPGPRVAVTEEDGVGADRLEAIERGERGCWVLVEAVQSHAALAGCAIQVDERITAEDDSALLRRERRVAGRVAW